MTRAEWNAVMQRYMHRADLTADLDQTFEFAQTQFDNFWMGATLPYTTEADLLALAPAAMTHAGLSYLHELAQDDGGLSRENQLFGNAMGAVQMRWSLNNVQPTMNRPYCPGDDNTTLEAPDAA